MFWATKEVHVNAKFRLELLMINSRKEDFYERSFEIPGPFPRSGGEMAMYRSKRTLLGKPVVSFHSLTGVVKQE
jgi:hypothetical protein